MSQERLEWRVGLFVLIGLVLLGLLVVLFTKGISPLSPTYKLYLTAKSVGGLKVRASVLMAGVEVGRVSDIRLNPQGRDVTITLQIHDEYVIRDDAQFLIQQSGFLGDQYVAIDPGENQGKPLRDGDHMTAQEPFDLQGVARSASGFIQRIDETARKLNDAIADVRRLVLNEETLTNLSVTVHTMRSASENALGTVNNINALVDTNGPLIEAAVSNITFFSTQINRFGSEFSSLITTNSVEIRIAIDNIQESTAVLRQLLEDLQAGKGMAGAVLRDEQLAENVEAITRNLAITTSNLNQRGLWGILWSRRTPRTNAPGETLVAPKYSNH